MTTFRQKLHSHASIPWILALVALFGCSVVASPKVALKKSAQINTGNVTHLADEAAPLTGPDRYFLGLGYGGSDHFNFSAPEPQLVIFDLSRGRVEITRRGGVVHGRAPPFRHSC